MEKTGHISISVVITTYNRAFMLTDAIESVLLQTRPADEILIIDDGSTDNTAEMVLKYGDRIRYVLTEHQGISKARNEGIRQTSGTHIAFLDSDDMWKRVKLAVQEQVAREYPEYPINYTEEIWIRKGQRVNQKLRHKKKTGWIFTESLDLCLVSPSSALISRQVFDQCGFFDESLPACEDYDLWLRVAHRFPFYFIDTPLIVKRGGHRDQLSHKFWGMDRFRIRVLQKLLTIPDLSPQERKAVTAVYNKKCTILRKGSTVRKKNEEERIYGQMLQDIDTDG